MIRALLAAMVVFVFVNWLMAHDPSPHWYELQAVTPAGDMYVAGAGSDCETAWIDPVFPVAVDHVGCVEVR